MFARAKTLLHSQDMLFLLGIALIAVLFLWPAWARPDSFWYPPKTEFSDITVTHWPRVWFVVQTLRAQRQIPLWLSPILGGLPFVGNPLSAYFAPFNWLFLVLPVTFTFHLLFALDILVAGLTCYGLLRWSYGRSAFAAFVGAAGYMLTPKLIGHIGAGHVGWCQAFGWLPLTLWLLRSAFDHKSALRAAWCGGVLALTFFADPRVAFYSAALQGLYALYRLIGLWRQSGWQAALQMAWRVALVPVALSLIGAAQMLPTLELMSATVRSALTLQEAALDSLPWRYLIGYLLSDWGGYYEWMTYLGLVPLGLVVVAWVRGGQERWFWSGLALFGLLFALGTNTPLYPLIFHLLPGLGWVRVPPRVLLLVAFSANLLSAMGADALFEWTWTNGARRWVTLVAFAGLLFCAAVGIGFALLMGHELSPAILLFTLVGTGLMGGLLMFVQGRLPPPVFRAVLVSLLLVDLYAIGHSLLVLRPGQATLAEGEDVAAYLAAQPGQFRVYSPSYSVRHHVGARFGIEQLDGVDPSQLRWMVQFMALAGGYPVRGYPITVPVFKDEGENWRTSLRDVVPNATLLGLFNCRFVVSDFTLEAPGLTLRTHMAPSYIYENERTMPRAFTMTRVGVVADWQEAQNRLAEGFDPTQGALVEAREALDGPPGWQEAQMVHFSPNWIVVGTEVEQAALLVLSEVWYPGWHAYVDGTRQPIYRVNGVMRGVYLQPGAHTVEWRYRPASLWWGLAISLAALVGLVAGSLVAARPRVQKNDAD